VGAAPHAGVLPLHPVLKHVAIAIQTICSRYFDWVNVEKLLLGGAKLSFTLQLQSVRIDATIMPCDR
jgi:hypothetical protein